jgi:HKD family nuclease
MRIILQPFSEQRLGDVLRAALQGEYGTFHTFQAAIAFIKQSGVQHLYEPLQQFILSGKTVRLVVGIDQQVTSQDGLAMLLDAVGSTGQIWINHTEGSLPVTFHPKVYLFEGDTSALLIIGSGNMTSGGLFTNDEASSVQMLDPQIDTDMALLNEVKSALDRWCDENQDNVRRLNSEVLQHLVEEGYVRSEAAARAEALAEGEETASRRRVAEGDEPRPRRISFGRGIQRRRPPRNAVVRRAGQSDEEPSIETELPPLVEALAGANWFAVTVLQGDLPQAGSSPEIRIGKAIRDVEPGFWGWRDFYEHDAERDQYTRNVRIRFNNQVIEAYLKDFPAKKPDGTKASADFRLGSVTPIVRSLREEDDMIVLELADEPNIDYVAHIVYKTDTETYEELADGMIQHTRSKSSVTGTYKKYKYLIQD